MEDSRVWHFGIDLELVLCLNQVKELKDHLVFSLGQEHLELL